jgi:hypothetical protein
MTTAMRAAPRPSRARCVRVAVVRGGRIVDERTLAPGEDVTVGPTERSAFVVMGVPSSTRVLEHTRAGYRLCLARGMRGRIANGGPAEDLDATGDARGGSAVALVDDARGRVAIGDSLLLFHLVDPPAQVVRLELPLAVRRRGFDGLDWKTTCIAAFSFLFHFGAVGTAYADFTDATIDDDGYLTRTVDILRTLPALPPVETRDAPSSKGDDATRQKDPAPTAPRGGGAKQPASGPAGGARTAGGGKMSDTRADRIARDLAAEGQLILEAIGARSDGATGRVLAHDEVPASLLDGVAADARGARPGSPAGLAMGGVGGAVRPGAGGGEHGLAAIANGARDAKADDTGVSGGPRKPIAAANVPPPDVSVGHVADAARVVAGLRGPLRACYKRELDTDPTAKGTIRVTATVGSNGEVRSVQTANGGLSSTMVACVSRVVRSAQFSPPEGGSAIVNIPVMYMPQ